MQSVYKKNKTTKVIRKGVKSLHARGEGSKV